MRTFPVPAEIGTCVWAAPGGMSSASPGLSTCARPSMTTFIAPVSGSRRSVCVACACSCVRNPRGRPVTSNTQCSPFASAPLSTIRISIPSSGISSTSPDFAIVRPSGALTRLLLARIYSTRPECERRGGSDHRQAGPGPTPPFDRSGAAASGLAVAAQLRALDPGGEAALLVELVEVRGQRDGGGRAQRGRRVGPHAVQQLVRAAQAVGQRALEPALAVEAVGDVLVELGVRVEDERPVTGAQDLEAAAPQAPQRGEVAAQRAGVGRDEDAARA